MSRTRVGFDPYEDIVLALIIILLFFLGFCFFGMYQSGKWYEIKQQRCAEVGGTEKRLYQSSVCLVRGRIIDVDRDDYLNQLRLVEDEEISHAGP